MLFRPDLHFYLSDIIYPLNLHLAAQMYLISDCIHHALLASHANAGKLIFRVLLQSGTLDDI